MKHPVALGAGLEQAGLKRRVRSLGLEDVLPVVAPGNSSLSLRAVPVVSANSHSGQYPQPNPFLFSF